MIWPHVKTLTSKLREVITLPATPAFGSAGGVTVTAIRSLVYRWIIWLPEQGTLCLRCGKGQQNAEMPKGQDKKQLQDLGPRGQMTWLLAQTLNPFAKTHRTCVADGVGE